MGQPDVVVRRNILALQPWTGGPVWLVSLAALCAFEAAFYFAYRYAMTFSQATASPFWFPDSVLLVALLVTPRRSWWIWVLAPLPIRLLVATPADTPSWFLLATFVVDSAKGVVTAAALRRFLVDPTRFSTVRDYSLYALFAVLLVPAVSALAGAAARAGLGYDYWPSWEQWFLGDALANLIVTPTILYWLLAGDRKSSHASNLRWSEAALVAAGLIVTSYLAFQTASDGAGFAEARFYAPVPFLFWVGIRFGMRGATGAMAILTLFAVGTALNDRGPFAGQSAGDTALALQNFLLLRAAPLYFVAVLSEQKQVAERSLRESEGRFRAMADSAPVLIWMSDAAKSFEFLNQGWVAFTGRTLEQERGEGWMAGVHPEDLQRCIDVRQAAFNARLPFEMEYRLRRRDGEYRWVIAKGVPRSDATGAFVGYVGCAIDITDRKRAEEANRRLAHVSRLAVVGELTAMVAHEIKQPLGAILSNADAAELLLKSATPPLPEIRAMLADIRKDDLRADAAIRRLRTLLREREIEMRPLDLNETVIDVLQLVAGDAVRRRVELCTNLAPDLPLAFGDRVHLQHVLLNLIVNAMDAMQDKPESARQVNVQTRSQGVEGIEVAVVDNGHGIPEGEGASATSSIFDSFVTTKEDGMGLGLAIARSIIESHAGRIWATNNVDGGATFRFVIRAADSALDRSEDTHATAAKPGDDSASGLIGRRGAAIERFLRG